MSINKITKTLLCAATVGLALSAGAVRAADHGDAPALAQDLGADIADVYAFLDPNDTSQVVLIATIHGFIVPAEARNFAIFDEDLRYAFHIENTGDSTPDMFIDVTFNQVQRPPSGNIPGFNVPRSQQDAFVSFRGRGPADLIGARNKSFGRVTQATLDAQPLVTPTASDLMNAKGESVGVKFFAGQVDDPFFFDIPAFSAFVSSGNPSVFSRARDSFAGYNIMAIALRIPAAKLLSSKTGAPKKIGVAFSTARKTQHAVKGNQVGVGAYFQVDRLGVPGINVALIPYNSKNSYNGGTTIDDGKGKFHDLIASTLVALGTSTTIPILKTVAGLPPVFPIPRGGVLGTGDYLRLNTDAADPQNLPGFPNGRRLTDDVIDTILTLVNNGAALSDNVNSSEPFPALQSVFPFLAPAHQPLDNGVDDATRN
jgi:hypothetical protein